ncbi:CRAL-TRIO domain-containing protein, partial [Lachnellula subtilissima]
SCATNRSLCNLRKPSQRGFRSPRNAEPITHRSTYTPPKPLRSSAGSWAIAIVASIVATLYAISSSDVKSATNPKQQQPVSEGLKFLLESEGFENFDMADASLPGRVSNLTPEQEDKLKEFWVATLQVFGVMDQNGQADPGPIKARSDTASLKKPKKKRFGMLRRNHDGDADSIASTDSGSKTPIVPADDDKYGQTKEFHDAIASLSPESLRAAFWSMLKHDHPDALLLRFLRARKWDVEKALVMMISTMRWRASDIHVDDDIMKNGELGSLEAANGDDPIKQKLGEGFLAQMRLGKSFLHGLDKGGRPMCFIRVRLHKQGEQSEESLERYTVFTIETARMLLAPPADTACVVFDMTGFSMANMDYAPVKFMIKCFEANYPESLGVVLVHKAPWIFQGIWKIIKGWLDPVVASKIQFTNNNQEMEEFVPKEHIIKELGGAEDWAYTYIEPVPGENDKMKDTATRDKLLLEREDVVKAYERETLEWIHSKETDAMSLKQKRHDLAATLRDGYWILDPYVRARSYYDRSGLIGQGGVPHFYPSKVTPAAAANGPTSVETSAADLD